MKTGLLNSLAGLSSTKMADKKKREKLIIKYVPLVKNIVGRIAMRLPDHVDKDDLISAGIMGLMSALEKFDETKKVRFETYAQFRIQGAVLDELRSKDDAPRSVRSKETMLKDALEVLWKKFGRHPMDEEISHYLGISLKNYYKLLDEARGVRILSNDDLPPSYCEKYGRHDVLEKIDQNNPFFLLADRELKNILKNAIDSLPEKEKLVLSLYYYEELTLKEIGLTLKLTESRVCQLHSLAILRLKGGLKKFRHDIT